MEACQPLEPGEIPKPCPCCQSPHQKRLLFAAAIPVQNTSLFRDREKARFVERGDLDLRVCLDCGFIFNRLFNPELTLYGPEYEETQGYSPTFQRFHEVLADDLIRRFALTGKRILEIGCGKGEFLAILCRGGRNRGVGLDPAYREDRHPDPENSKLEFRREQFCHGDSILGFDAICCKMTLEHIPDVRRFVDSIASGLGTQKSRIFFQVPEMSRILKELAFWDIYYEHCSYFTHGSLKSLFEAAGFLVDEVWTGYDDQYLMISASWMGHAVKPPGREESSLKDLFQAANRFQIRIDEYLNEWRDHLEDLRKSGQKMAIWGGSSKTVAFLSYIQVPGVVSAVVDINPNKQGTFLAASGLPIIGPDDLESVRPDEILITNPVYTAEIKAELARLKLHPGLVTINNPGRLDRL